MTNLFLPVSILGLRRLQAVLWIFDQPGHFQGSPSVLPSISVPMLQSFCEESGELSKAPPELRNLKMLSFHMCVYLLSFLAGILLITFWEMQAPLKGRCLNVRSFLPELFFLVAFLGLP